MEQEKHIIPMSHSEHRPARLLYPEPYSVFPCFNMWGNYHYNEAFEAFCAETRLSSDIYDANMHHLRMDGAEKQAEREARLRRTIGERSLLMIEIARTVNGTDPA